MSRTNDIWLEQAMKIQETAEWNCGEHPEILQENGEQYSDEILQEHIEQCLDEMLAAYISDERNYVVDCAEIECTEMCDNVHCIKYEDKKTTLYDVIQGIDKGVERDGIPDKRSPGEKILLGKELDMDKVRKLYALHAKEADDNGIRYATVIDRTCLRDVKEGTGHLTSPIEGELSGEACIVSCGNCKILRKSDIDEIEKRLDESIEYGTCYSLIKPVWEWTNPFCIESVSGNCDQKPDESMLDQRFIERPDDNPYHHKVMMFDTEYGMKKGLTMLSTLLCWRGGIIKIKVHGQIYIDPTIGFQFTLGEVRACGWEITEEELNRLNRAMRKFGVTSKVSAYMMLATMLHESGNCSEAVEAESWLRDAIDSGDTNEIEAAWARYKADVRANGGNVGNYEWWERGAGYIQLTHAGNQRAFLSDMGESYDEIEGDVPTYIGDKYAIESAVWYWAKLNMTGEGNLNTYVKVNGDSEKIFLITQYYVNGFPDGIGNTLTGIREGNIKYNINVDNNQLEVDGNSFPLPNGWTDRVAKWETAKDEMNKE